MQASERRMRVTMIEHDAETATAMMHKRTTTIPELSMYAWYEVYYACYWGPARWGTTTRSSSNAGMMLPATASAATGSGNRHHSATTGGTISLSVLGFAASRPCRESVINLNAYKFITDFGEAA